MFGECGLTEVTMTANGTITKYYAVKLSTTEDDVSPITATTDIPFGIALQTVSDNEEVRVALIGGGGICPVVSSGTIAGAVIVSPTTTGAAQAAAAHHYPIGQVVRGADSSELLMVALGSVIVKA